MIKKVFKFLATRLLVGKLFEKVKPKLPLISILTFIIFIVFYGPYEYENFLEFKQKFPENTMGLYLNLLRPLVIITLIIGAVIYIFLSKKKYEREEAERIAQEKAEQERQASARLLAQMAELKAAAAKNQPKADVTVGVYTTRSLLNPKPKTEGRKKKRSKKGKKGPKNKKKLN